jgi:serine/threonine protein kinase
LSFFFNQSTFGDFNQNVKSGAEPKLSVKLSDSARDLISKLLVFQPDQRLGCQNNEDAIKLHPFFDDIDWTLLAQKQLPSPFLSQMTPLAPLMPDEQPKFGSVIDVLIHFEECDKKRQLELALTAELAI